MQSSQLLFSYTNIIIAITVGISLWAFNDDRIRDKLILFPFGMDHKDEYHRVLSSGFIHGDYGHLFFNMYTLYAFGSKMETICTMLNMRWVFLVIYLSSIIVGSLPAYFKNRHNSSYFALGASGGVSGILFATFYYDVWGKVTFIGLGNTDLGIYGIVFGIIYLAYSYFMAKRGSDNIGHDAHFFGAVYGFIFAFLIDPTHGQIFINQISNHHF